MSKYLITDITWIPNKWTGEPNNKELNEIKNTSGHEYVVKGNTPHECYNFSKKAQEQGYKYAYSKWTHYPKENENLEIIFFYSNNLIVGYFLYPEINPNSWVLKNKNGFLGKINFNIRANSTQWLAFENFIEFQKPRHFVKKRVGQIGFGILEKNNVKNILEDAIIKNPNQKNTLQDISITLGLSQSTKSSTEGNNNWTQNEVEMIVKDYLKMLAHEINGKPFNKTAHRNILIQKLNKRTPASIEYKHQNISAVLLSLDLPYIEGYKPAWNYQNLIKEVVSDLANKDHNLFEITNEPPKRISRKSSKLILDAETPPPIFDEKVKPLSSIKLKRWESDKGIKFNQTERDESNKNLGDRGEEFVLKFEKARLIREGKPDLAKKVEQISKTKGDGLGYDIKSYNKNGSFRWIEVKTTNQGIFFPFYISANELACSKDQPKKYFLYRVYSFNKDPKLYILNGDLSQKCKLEIKSYSALPSR